jgi:hypothetical protein
VIHSWELSFYFNIGVCFPSCFPGYVAVAGFSVEPAQHLILLESNIRGGLVLRQMDVGAVLITILAAVSYGWVGLKSGSQTSPWMAVNPFVGLYGFCQLLYSMIMLFVMAFHMKW